MFWLAGTFRWQFSQRSLPIHPHFNHQSVTLLLRNKNLNYMSLNFAEKNSQTVFKHSVILIFDVLMLLVFVYWVDQKSRNVSRVNCPSKFSVNCTAKRYVYCNTFWSLMCALIMLIPLCNCFDFNVNLKGFIMLKKTKGFHPNLQSCQVYTQTLSVKQVKVTPALNFCT